MLTTSFTHGSDEAICRIEAVSSGDARSPISSALLSRASTTATAASTPPIRIEARPSIHGAFSWTEKKVPSVAMVMPISAAETSKNTMKLVGSLLTLTAVHHLRLPLASRKLRQPNHQDA